MATASVRDVCADILDGLAGAESTWTPVNASRWVRLIRGAETLRWVEGF
jgi:hypothetical protein